MAGPTFGSGVSSIPGYGQREKFLFAGTWADGDIWSIETTSTEGDFTLGAGRLYGSTWSYLLTFNRRMYAANGAQVNFSDNGDATGWEEQNPGAGFVLFQTNYGPVDTVKALASFQGRLAFFGTYNIQIWNVDADPANFALAQVLQNIGTISPVSVKGLGDLDVMFLHTSGIRSLRARETTLNAFVTDLGSPLDQLLQGIIPGLSTNEVAGVCSVVEPDSGRYWVFIKDTIYVFSYYPQLKIAAWGTYTPTYQETFSAVHYDNTGQSVKTGLTVGRVYTWIKSGSGDTSVTIGSTTLTDSGQITATATSATFVGTPNTDTTTALYGQVPFTPSKFVVLDNIVYARSATGYVVAYGGGTGLQYDNVQTTVGLPWLDDKQPATKKLGDSVDLNGAGAWTFYAGMDPAQNSLTTIGSTGSTTTPSELTDATFDNLRFACPLKGTHFKLKAVSSPYSFTSATLSGLVFKYNIAEK